MPGRIKPLKPQGPSICMFCRGTLQEGTTEFLARLPEQIVVVEDIPAWVCSQCGEAYFDANTAQLLDQLVELVKDGNVEPTPLVAGKLSFSSVL